MPWDSLYQTYYNLEQSSTSTSWKLAEQTFKNLFADSLHLVSFCVCVCTWKRILKSRRRILVAQPLKFKIDTLCILSGPVSGYFWNRRFFIRKRRFSASRLSPEWSSNIMYSAAYYYVKHHGEYLIKRMNMMKMLLQLYHRKKISKTIK